MPTYQAYSTAELFSVRRAGRSSACHFGDRFKDYAGACVCAYRYSHTHVYMHIYVDIWCVYVDVRMC